MMMGLEEHLLQMFRDDFEFHDAAPASHLPATARPVAAPAQPADAGLAAAVADSTATSSADSTVDASADTALALAVAPPPAASEPVPGWTAEGERELKKIPFFVRAKARRNTERFAAERGVSPITVETIYEAKAHFGR
jgi:light-independent protochlorophyllide reductase subunit B